MPQPCSSPGASRIGALATLGAIAVFLCLPASSAAQATALGAGAGWFDCNNDSYLDLCYMTPEGKIFLLVFDPAQGRFEDHSATAFPLGLQSSRPGLGVACGDVNNDGFSDLFLTFDGANHLLLNNGDDSFTAVGRQVGIVPGREGEVMSSTAAFLDYDRDGLLDIFVANYEGNANQLFHNEGIDGEGLPGFVDVAPNTSLEYGDHGQSRWSLGVAVGDYDNDGDPDIYVANDYDGQNPDDGSLNPGPNILYRNDGGTFVDVTYEAGVADGGWAMGTAWGDYNNDGLLDLFVANFWQDALYHNNGNGTFTNVTAMVGLPSAKPSNPEDPWTYNSWGTSFIDYDNDGDLDIHVTNGYITNGEGQVFDEPNELWENLGRGGNGFYQFEEVGTAAGIDDIGDGRGAAYGDFNRDGFVDIAVFNNNYVSGGSEPGAQELLFVNRGDGTFQDMGRTYNLRPTMNDGPVRPPRGSYGQNGWIEVELLGVQSNRDAFGSRVIVQVGTRIWIQDRGTGSYCSSNSPLLHFGIGNNTMVDRVTVIFPSGTRVTKVNIPARSILTIAESDPTPVRLLAFEVEGVPGGARVHWQYADDEGLVGFSVDRLRDGEPTVVASLVPARGGEGEVVDADPPVGVPVTYRLAALFRDGSREELASAAFRYEPGLRPVLGQNFPNPFTASTVIPLAASPGGRIAEVHIFDAGGRLVRVLQGGETGGSLSWNGEDAAGRRVPAGTYFYRLAGENRTLKMIRRP